MQEIDFLRIQRETQKFLEIDNIFSRLSQSFVNRLFSLFKDIFQCEHEYTIQELLKLAIQKEIPLKEFKLAEHYKLNSHIFKANLSQIVNVMIDDIWVLFNKQILIDEKHISEPRLLTQIDEESHVDLQSSDMMNDSSDKNAYKSERGEKTEQSDRILVINNQMKITPRQKNHPLQKFIENPEIKTEQKTAVSSARIPLARLLSTERSNPQSIISSPRQSKENSCISKQSIQNSKKKNASLIKNKSMDLKQFAEGLMKSSPKSNPLSANHLHNLMQKMQFRSENNITK